MALDPSSSQDAFRRILDRCGVHYIALNDELIALSPDGDQLITRGSQYEANLKRARSVPKPPVIEDPESDLSPEEFHTPAKKTIADVTSFTGLPETSQMKSLVMVVDDAPVLILLRGDHTLNEHKLHASAARQATADEIRRWFHADAGSLGPIGVTGLRILADEALRGRKNMICGANRNDYHLRNVTPGEDFQAEFLDLRMVVEDDTSLIDGAPLRFERAFTLASTRDIPSDLHVSNESGKEVTPRLTHHRLFLDRILTAAAGQQYDIDGLMLAPAIAPFGVVITPVSLKDASQHQAAHDLHAELTSAGFDPLLDDRDERPGVKFKDADLIGIPFRVTLGKKLAQGLAEVMDRRTRESQDVPLDRVAVFLSDKGCNE
jgi:prolyl-tRNA synthetase